MLVIVKSLLVEHVVAVLTLNPWNCGMTLALMVGQTFLGQGLEGEASAVQSSHKVDESLLVTMLLLIFMNLLIVSASIWRCSTLCWMVVHQESRS